MKVIIEMPKGDSRRRHLNFEKTGFVDLGPIKDKIPVNDGIMPIAYGYIPGTLNENEGDEIDVLVFSGSDFEVGQEVEINAIALLRRADGDDKIVAIDQTKNNIKCWEDISEEKRAMIVSFFGFHSKFEAFENAQAAQKYIDSKKSKNFQK